MATVTRAPSNSTKRSIKQRGSSAEQSALGSLIETTPGWLGVKDLYLIESGLEPLSVHADWAGPVKIVRGQGCHLLRGEVFLPDLEVADESCDDAHTGGGAALRAAVVAGVFGRQPGPMESDWQPPLAELLTQWLDAAGYAATVDEQHNPRLNLKSRGCDGQVRFDCQPGRLRLTLELARWPRLSPVVEQAVLRLARRTNAGVRLARIAWFAEGETRRCEAQVDLSRLPLAADSTEQETFSAEMLRLAVASLELVLARLGLELEVLTDPRQQALAEQLMEQPD